MAGPTSKPFQKAFIFAAITYIPIGILIFGVLGAPVSGEGLGLLMGTVFLPALITGFWAWRSSRMWSLWRVGLTFLAIFAIFALFEMAQIANKRIKQEYRLSRSRTVPAVDVSR